MAEHSIRVCEHLFLTHFRDPDVIIFAPFLLEPIEDESKVVATLGVSIVDNDGVQVVRGVVHVLVGDGDLLVLLLDLRLHLHDLLLHIAGILSESLDEHLGVGSGRLVQGKESYNSIDFSIHLLALPLLGEESVHQV